MPVKFANNAISTLLSGVSNSDTSFSLPTGQGAVFPTLSAGEYFYLTVSAEIVKVTARSGDSLTVVRAQESTTATPHAAGTQARLLVTAAGLEDIAPQNFSTASLGVGTAASGVSGEIRATNNITAYYSDDRLKTKLGGIEDALGKVRSLSGFYYEANKVAQSLGYEVKREVGVSAQQVQAVQPEVVAPAPIDEQYLTVRYERLVPLLIQAIKELDAEVQLLKAKVKG